MLKEMKFVQGSVAKKDLLPALTHFRIENGHIQGFNGRIALCAKIDFDIDCTPKAAPLVSAISKCEETIVLGMTKSGKLSIKSGKFRTYIECVEGPTAHVQPEGEEIDINGDELLKALRILEPFISNDAARPWSTGVLFSGRSAYATNNVVIGEYWLDTPFPIKVVIPRVAVKEMLRIKEPPVSFQMSESSFTARYQDGRWLRCNLIDSEWPNINALLESKFTQTAQPIPEGFFEGLAAMKDFTDKYNRITFIDGEMRTHMDGNEEGAEFSFDWLNTIKATFSLPMILSLQGVATHIDLTTYPDPCPWYGENVRGLIIGMHWLEGQ